MTATEDKMENENYERLVRAIFKGCLSDFTPIAHLIDSEAIANLNTSIANLTEVESTVILNYYALNTGAEKMTQEKIGALLGIGAGKVGLINKKALRKLAHRTRSQFLLDRFNTNGVQGFC